MTWARAEGRRNDEGERERHLEAAVGKSVLFRKEDPGCNTELTVFKWP